MDFSNLNVTVTEKRNQRDGGGNEREAVYQRLLYQPLQPLPPY